MATQRLLVAGAINTDLVATMARAPRAGETITAAAFAQFGGGKGANQAISAARNGASVVMLGACGTDRNGADRTADLNAEGIDSTWVRIDPAHASGVALIFVEESGENRIAYVPGATQHIPKGHVLSAFAATTPAMILATHELPPAALTALFREARQQGTHIVFNATPEPVSALEVLRYVDVLIVNEGEAAALLGVTSFDPDGHALESLLDHGPESVVITQGARGALVVRRNDRITVSPPTVSVVDTTGAGDAFCGAFAAALLCGASLHDATQHGVHAGALATEVAGAQPSAPRLRAVEESIRRVQE